MECKDCNKIKKDMHELLGVCYQCIHNHWKTLHPALRSSKVKSGTAKNATQPGPDRRVVHQRFSVTVTYAAGLKK